MTHLLLVSLNYAPEPTGIGPYSAGVASHLAAQGYEVSAITGLPHYPAWRVGPAYARGARRRERIDGVAVHRSSHYVPRRQSAVRRALYELSSLSMLAPLRNIPRPDAVLGITPSLSGAVVARLAAMRFDAPYGVVFHDLAGHAGQSGMRGAGVAAVAARGLERLAVARAAAVGIVAEGFRPYVEALGVEPVRVRRLRNWARISPPAVARGEMRRRLGWPDDAFCVVHTGNMGYKQALETVLLAARETAGSRDMLFALCGDGSQRAALVRQARALALDNVRFVPLVSEAAYSSLLAAADVLLVHQRASVREMALPSKLASYFVAGRPVLAAAARGSETAREVQASGGGIVIAPEDPRALLDGLRRLQADPALRDWLADRGRTYAEKTLSPAAALRGYEQFVAAILAATGRGRVHHAGRAPVGQLGGSLHDERRAA